MAQMDTDVLGDPQMTQMAQMEAMRGKR